MMSTSSWASTKLVRLEGFEPPTFSSVVRCSNPLSYKRIVPFGNDSYLI